MQVARYDVPLAWEQKLDDSSEAATVARGQTDMGNTLTQQSCNA
jgi:hypothetical protein